MCEIAELQLKIIFILLFFKLRFTTSTFKFYELYISKYYLTHLYVFKFKCEILKVRIH